MDLLQTVRKEGSRGGVNFSWSDVKTSQHRENYLGHSLMAPVGRWQQNKDLSWYAKAEDAELTAEQRAEKEKEAKREEMRKVKEAEEDAMAKALGLPVPERRGNANLEPLGLSGERQREVNMALKEALKDDDGKEDEERGIGFGKYGAVDGDGGKEVLKGSRSRREEGSRRERRRGEEDERDRRLAKRSRRSRSRSRSRDRDRDRRKTHRRYRNHNRSRSPARSRERSRSRDRRRNDDQYRVRRRSDHERSRSRERTYRRRRSRSRSR